MAGANPRHVEQVIDDAEQVVCRETDAVDRALLVGRRTRARALHLALRFPSLGDINDGAADACPPGPDVITRFQIPNPVTGYVEFAITRANFYFIDSGINSVGQREFIVREPLMPSINPRTLRPTRALYIGEYAFGLQVTDVCF